MGTRKLLKLLKEHQSYCIKNVHASLAHEKSESLLHFTWWLETVWLPADDIKRKRITESIRKAKQK
jgi:hypothetical protein